MAERTPTLAEVINQAIDDVIADVHVMLPGRIENYDASTQKADVKPLLRRTQKVVDGEINEELPVIPSVPIAWPRCGQWRITIPVTKGDRCMLVFCDRSIDNYQIGQADDTDPESFQMHDLSDAVAIMGWYPDIEALDPTDAEDMVLGKQSEPSIHLGRDLVNLYEKNAAAFIARADRVLDELELIKEDFQAFKTVSESHTHVYVDNIGSPPTPTPSQTKSPTTLPAIPITWPTPHTPQEPKTDKVKGT